MIETIIIVAGISISSIVLGSLALTNAILKREDEGLNKEEVSTEDFNLWKDLTKRAQDIVSGLEKEASSVISNKTIADLSPKTQAVIAQALAYPSKNKAKKKDIAIQVITNQSNPSQVKEEKEKKAKIIEGKRALLERSRFSHATIANDFYEDGYKRSWASKEVARIDAELLKLVEEENS